MILYFCYLDHTCLEQSTYYEGFDLKGGCGKQPYAWKRENPKECLLLCQQTDACEWFTWISSVHSWVDGRQRCCLKYKANPHPTFQEGAVSGPRDCGNYCTIKYIFNLE